MYFKTTLTFLALVKFSFAKFVHDDQSRTEMHQKVWQDDKVFLENSGRGEERVIDTLRSDVKKKRMISDVHDSGINICRNGWVEIGHSCYYFSNVKATWSKARSSCNDLKGDLVVPKNAITSKEIGKVVQGKNMGQPWIGIVRHQDRNFYTIFGSKPSYTNWAPSEPNNGGGSENCGHIVTKLGQWNDVSCGRLYRFICQEKRRLVRQEDKKCYTISGSKPSYTNWASGEPNNPNSENCGCFWTKSGQWNDWICGNTAHFICMKHRSTSKLYCGENKIMLYADKRLFNVSSERDLQLLDSSCKPARETKSYYIFVTSPTECGTRMTTNTGGRTVTFTNKVMERKSAVGNYSITRSKEIQFPFSCHYAQSYAVSSSQFGLTNVIRTLDNITTKNKGNITLVMHIYRDESFTKPLITNPSLNKRVYVEIKMNHTNTTSDSSFGIQFKECFSTSNSQPKYKYILIKRGCAKDKTVKFHQSPGATARFSFRTFRFRGIRPYSTSIHCEVIFCDKENRSCSQPDCQSPSKKKRVLPDQDDEQADSSDSLELEMH